MAFTEVASLDTDGTVTLGGVDKKTGKKNPTKAEGYFLGTRNVGPNKYNKAKENKIHVLQTPNGNLGVWGKTNMDQKLSSVTPGTMIRISYTGDKDVGKGNPMQCFKVEVDAENYIEVGDLSAASDANQVEAANEEYEEEIDPQDEEPAADEVPPARASAPKTPAAVPNAERQAKVRQLLGGGRKAVS